MYYVSPNLSLADLLGKDYTDAVVAANEALSLLPPGEARRLACEKVDFYPLSLQEKADSLLSSVGKQVVSPFENDADGAPTDSFRKAMHKFSAPVTGFGPYRVGEDGRQLDYQRGCSREGPFSLRDYPGLVHELPSACNKLWRRSLFAEGVRFPGRLWFEDLATSPRLYLRAETIRAIHRPWLRYLQRSGSITKAKDPSRNREIIDALALVLEDFRQQGAFADYEKELELLAVKHQLLASTVRVNLADPRSPLQRELLEELDRSFPKWRENPGLARLPAQHRLLLKLMDGQHYGAVHALMRANNLLKGKRV